MNKPRLIDANALKRELSHAIWLPEWEHIRDKVLKDIDERPTAYDIDEVVEQLKQEQKTPNSYVYAWDAYEKAIEIVKGGAE